MVDITKELDAIRNAVYGEEVRDSIIEALNKINKASSDVSADTISEMGFIKKSDVIKRVDVVAQTNANGVIDLGIKISEKVVVAVEVITSATSYCAIIANSNTGVSNPSWRARISKISDMSAVASQSVMVRCYCVERGV